MICQTRLFHLSIPKPFRPRTGGDKEFAPVVGEIPSSRGGSRPLELHPAAQRVQAALHEVGLDVRIVEFAESTRTSADAAAAVGTTVGQIAKSLVFLSGGEPVLVIASGANRVDTAKVARLTGAPVRRADGDLVKAHTGFAIGGVPPVGHARPLRTLIDQDLFQYAGIWAAAGTPHAVFPLTPADLQRITGGTVADVREEPK